MRKYLKYKRLIAIFICIIFVCGLQLAFAEPVSAAKLKKFDSGKIKIEGITVKYNSYYKGKNYIRMKLYAKIYSTNIPMGTIQFTKGKTKVKITMKIIGSKTKGLSFKHYGMSTKTFYRMFKNELNNY
ncbi:hypothetical protein [Methanobrevibacter filiformis]|uniref:Uncharacterized protein n=1 Tax=Methanobrevibacter filiformis TaxID=55758 RepID=A0A165Z9R6_9EURY|nr:hypothetical protein [Methanobrevibacter filiformis]KZX10446.1 hypothetical protein MBFIL_17450 [Methanobrevibacter filiformis]